MFWHLCQELAGNIYGCVVLGHQFFYWSLCFSASTTLWLCKYSLKHCWFCSKLLWLWGMHCALICEWCPWNLNGEWIEPLSRHQQNTHFYRVSTGGLSAFSCHLQFSFPSMLYIFHWIKTSLGLFLWGFWNNYEWDCFLSFPSACLS